MPQKKGQAGRRDWEKIEAEYITQDEVDSISEFFRRKGIPVWSGLKHSRGWAQKRQEFWKRVAEKALKRAEEKRAKILERQAKMGQALSTAAFKRLIDTATGELKIQPKTAKEAAEIVKDGLEIERKALRLEEEDQPASALAVGVELSIGEEDLERIRVLAKTIARRQAVDGNAGLPVLGDQ